MAATKQDLSRWFDNGKAQGATHMVVVCDTYDWDDYPVYVKPGEDPRTVANKYSGKNMQTVMECYNLTLDKEMQMKEHRAHHYEKVESE